GSFGSLGSSQHSGEGHSLRPFRPCVRRDTGRGAHQRLSQRSVQRHHHLCRRCAGSRDAYDAAQAGIAESGRPPQTGNVRDHTTLFRNAAGPTGGAGGRIATRSGAHLRLRATQCKRVRVARGSGRRVQWDGHRDPRWLERRRAGRDARRVCLEVRVAEETRLMVSRLLDISLRQRMLVIICALMIGAGGIYAFRTIPIDAFPDVTSVLVQVVTKAPGLSPAEVERLVTYPIELQLTGVPSLTEMRSLTKVGLSLITLVFDASMDINLARQLVLERLLEVEEQLPPGAEPMLVPNSTGLGEVFQYYLESPPGSATDADA